MMRFRPLRGARVVGSVGSRPRPRGPAGLPAKGPCAGARAAEGVGGRSGGTVGNVGRAATGPCWAVPLGWCQHPPPTPLLAKASVGPRGRHTIDLRRPLRRPALPAGGAAAARGGPWRPVARRAATNVVRTTMVRHQHLSPPTAHAAAVFPWSVPRPGLLGAAATPPHFGAAVWHRRSGCARHRRPVITTWPSVGAREDRALVPAQPTTVNRSHAPRLDGGPLRPG